MTTETMKYINNLMGSLSIPYAFMEWKSKPPGDRYFVGEYTETPMATLEEDGRQETTFILRGFTRGDWGLLEKDKAAIEKSVAVTTILPDGTGLAIFYGGGYPVPTGDAELKSIKINLTIQEWKVI